MCVFRKQLIVILDFALHDRWETDDFPSSHKNVSGRLRDLNFSGSEVNPRRWWFLKIVAQLSLDIFLRSFISFSFSTCQLLAHISLALSVVSGDEAKFGTCIPCACFIFSGMVAHCRSELVLSTIGCTFRWCTAVNQAVVTVAVAPLHPNLSFFENVLVETRRRLCDIPTKAGRPRAVPTF